MQTSSIFTTWFTSLLYTDKFSPELGNYNVHSTDFIPIPGKVFKTIPTYHSPRTTLLSCARTKLPFCIFRFSSCHFWRITKSGNRSIDYFFQNICTMRQIWSNICLFVTLSLWMDLVRHELMIFLKSSHLDINMSHLLV